MLFFKLKQKTKIEYVLKVKIPFENQNEIKFNGNAYRVAHRC